MSIAEHMIMVSLMLMRQMNVIYRKSISGEWGSRLPQKSLRGSRINVLGTGDIGCTFAQRVHSFEPASITGLCRSGKCSERSFDRIFRIDHLEDILPETDLLIMCLPETSETIGIMSKERISLTLISSFFTCDTWTEERRRSCTLLKRMHACNDLFCYGLNSCTYVGKAKRIAVFGKWSFSPFTDTDNIYFDISFYRAQATISLGMAACGGNACLWTHHA
ncbi:MAG: hypothetical protein II842_02390 [Butyrivibrio sp.]|nr:hypothetical protein [Butyrivibrio sp.]